MDSSQVSLNRILQAISYNSSRELNILLEQLEKNKELTDPELKTSRFLDYIKQTKKHYLQLLSLVKWYNQNDSKFFFQTMSEYNTKLGNLSDSLFSSSLDSIYKTHASLYSQRSLQYDVTTSLKLISDKTLVEFAKKLAPLDPKPRDENLLIPNESKNLDFIMKNKLMLDPIPSCNFIYGEISNGCLHISMKDFFQVDLSLVTASLNSAWKLIGFRATIKPFQYFSQENILIQVPEQPAFEEINGLPSPLTLNISRLIEENIKTISPDQLTIKNIIDFSYHQCFLKKFESLYYRFVDLKSDLRYKDIDSQFSNLSSNPGKEIKTFFWPSIHTKNFSFGFSLVYDYSDIANINFESPLKCQLLIRPLANEEPFIGLSTNLTNFDLNSNFRKSTNLQQLIQLGKKYFAIEKLKFLYQRILFTFAHSTYKTFAESLQVKFLNDEISIILPETNASFSIALDLHTGSFYPRSEGLELVIPFAQSVILLIIEEVNNIESERSFIQYIIHLNNNSEFYFKKFEIFEIIFSVFAILKYYYQNLLSQFSTQSSLEELKLLQTLTKFPEKQIRIPLRLSVWQTLSKLSTTLETNTNLTQNDSSNLPPSKKLRPNENEYGSAMKMNTNQLTIDSNGVILIGYLILSIDLATLNIESNLSLYNISVINNNLSAIKSFLISEQSVTNLLSGPDSHSTILSLLNSWVPEKYKLQYIDSKLQNTKMESDDSTTNYSLNDNEKICIRFQKVPPFIYIEHLYNNSIIIKLSLQTLINSSDNTSKTFFHNIISFDYPLCFLQKTNLLFNPQLTLQIKDKQKGLIDSLIKYFIFLLNNKITGDLVLLDYFIFFIVMFSQTFSSESLTWETLSISLSSNSIVLSTKVHFPNGSNPDSKYYRIIFNPLEELQTNQIVIQSFENLTKGKIQTTSLTFSNFSMNLLKLQEFYSLN